MTSQTVCSLLSFSHLPNSLSATKFSSSPSSSPQKLFSAFPYCVKNPNSFVQAGLRAAVLILSARCSSATFPDYQNKNFPRHQALCHLHSNQQEIRSSSKMNPALDPSVLIFFTTESPAIRSRSFKSSFISPVFVQHCESPGVLWEHYVKPPQTGLDAAKTSTYQVSTSIK